MKFIHLSDLHIGKRVNEFSMLDDQKYILLEIIEIIEKQKPDFVMISGDVYDKTQPSGEAVRLLDDFIFRLCHGMELTALRGAYRFAPPQAADCACAVAADCRRRSVAED